MSDLYLRGIAQKQDKGLRWDFPAILVEFSPDSVAWKQTKLSYYWDLFSLYNKSSSNSDR